MTTSETLTMYVLIWWRQVWFKYFIPLWHWLTMKKTIINLTLCDFCNRHMNNVTVSNFTLQHAPIDWCFSCFNFVYSVFMLVLWVFNWDYESVSTNTKLNLITWWICFSFKKVDRRSAIIHVLPRLHPLKGRTVHANWTAFIVYRAQRTNVNTLL